jgi:hypothetical protein
MHARTQDSQQVAASAPKSVTRARHPDAGSVMRAVAARVLACAHTAAACVRAQQATQQVTKQAASNKTTHRTGSELVLGLNERKHKGSSRASRMSATRGDSGCV